MNSTNNVKANLNSLKLSDIYSLMLFIMYKTKEIPEYAVLSELCYLLDSNGIQRLLTYFAGKTITIPTEEEFQMLTNALLMYQYINIEQRSFTEAMSSLGKLTAKQKEKVTDLYVKIIPIINNYNIDRTQVQKRDR